MATLSSFLRSPPTQDWLSQFAAHEQPLAMDMLRALKLVSRDEFSERLRQLILDCANGVHEPIGLYAERELNKRKGVPHRLFKQPKRKPRRAHGIGPQPVHSLRGYAPDVGSEGLVAQLISELKREFPRKFVDHPGPDAIRKKKLRRFIVVTDLIGSGTRARTYLEAAWRVQSVKSWWSGRSVAGLHFAVVAYTATDAGAAFVKKHKTLPEVFVVERCPTIKSEFGVTKARRISELCKAKAPDLPDNAALGYGGTGALIAFAHGAPNNAPVILHRSKGAWNALFPKRVTASVRRYFASSEPDVIRLRLQKMRQHRLSKSPWIDAATPEKRKVLLALASLVREPKTDEAISDRTGLTIFEVATAMKIALSVGWINGRRQLSDSGRAEIDRIRLFVEPDCIPLPKEPEVAYVPKSLRVPVE